MRLLFLIIILFPYRLAYADTELIVGSVTEHVMGRFENAPYSNPIGDNNNLINNHLAGVRFNSKKYRPAFFAGTNSIGEGMAGMLFSTRKGNYSPVLGGYLQNNKKFLDKGLQAFSAIPPVSDVGLMPIVGMEFSYKIIRTKNNYVEPILLVTPAIITLNIGFGFK